MATYSKLILFIATILLFAFYAYIYYPGFVYADSFDQYNQAVAGKFSDWHPPIISFIWYYIIKLTHAPSLLYISLIAIFYIALYILLLPFRLKVSLPLLAILSVCPLFMGWFGLVLKDIFVADGLFLVASIFSYYAVNKLSPSKPAKILCFIILIIISLARANAPFITAPFFVYLFAGWKCDIKTISASCLLCLFMLLCSGPINHKLLKAAESHPIISLEIFDLGGISNFSHQNLFPGAWTQKENDDILASCYIPLHWDIYAWGKCSFVTKKIDRNHLGKLWITEIMKHPLAYMQHRLSFFNSLIRFIGYDAAYIYYANVNPGYQSDTVIRPNLFYEQYSYLMSKLPRQPWYFGYFWIAIAFGLWISSVDKKEPYDYLINCIAISALFYFFAYLIIGVASDFRYLLPGAYILVIGFLLKWISLANAKMLTRSDKSGLSVALGISIIGAVL